LLPRYALSSESIKGKEEKEKHRGERQERWE